MAEIKLKLIMVSLIFLTGCASTMIDPENKRDVLRAIEGNHDYLTHQYKNLMDIFTITMEFPVVGAAVTAGKYDLGLLMGGYPILEGKGGYGWGAGFKDQVFGIGLRGGELSFYKAEQTVLFFNQQEKFRVAWPESAEKMASARNKQWSSGQMPRHMWYRIGFSIGLGIGAKVEINFGEIADFVAGIFGFDLFENRIRSVPIGIDLRDSNLDAWPKGLSRQRHVEVISLGGNKIEHIPDDIVQMSSLQGLDISDNNLKEIPKEIGQLKQLRVLNLSGNPIKNLPAELANLEKLEELVISSDPIPELPLEFSKFKSLQLRFSPQRLLTDEDKKMIRKAFPNINFN